MNRVGFPLHNMLAANNAVQASLVKRFVPQSWIFALPPERVIALARLILTTIALGATVLDTSRYSNNISVVYFVLALYLLFSTCSLCVVLFRPPSNLEQLFAHTVDITCVCILMHFDQGPNSPFFIFFTFILLSASLRWSWRGTIKTTLLRRP